MGRGGRWEIDLVPLLDREEEIAYSRADPEAIPLAVPLAECEPAFDGVQAVSQSGVMVKIVMIMMMVIMIVVMIMMMVWS